MEAVSADYSGAHEVVARTRTTNLTTSQPFASPLEKTEGSSTAAKRCALVFDWKKMNASVFSVSSVVNDFPATDKPLVPHLE
jgi:hypothetical protein